MANTSGKVRKIQKSRSTYYITIPHEVMEGLSWKERQKVVVKKSGSKILVEDWPAVAKAKAGKLTKKKK